MQTVARNHAPPLPPSGKRRLVAAGVLLLCGFLALLIATELSMTQGVDVAVDRYLSGIRSEGMISVMLVVTTIFSPAWLFIYAGLLDIFYLVRRSNQAAGQLTGVMLTALLAMASIKTVVARQRPIFGITILQSFSFPSGHATVVAAFFGFLLLYYRGRPASTVVRRLWMAGAWLMIALIGFSRLYLGYHYLSDVLGGYLLGFFWGVFWTIVLKGRFTPAVPGTYQVGGSRDP
jgi:undecaprenyl-diphosphatase